MSYTAQDLVAAARAVIQEIGPTELLGLQAAGAPIIDVREPAEYAAGHVPGAVNIPRGVLEFEVDGHPAVNGLADPALSHRERAIVLYCRTGGRSALATEALKRLGFADARSLAGGFNGWVATGHPVQS